MKEYTEIWINANNGKISTREPHKVIDWTVVQRDKRYTARSYNSKWAVYTLMYV